MKKKRTGLLILLIILILGLVGGVYYLIQTQEGPTTSPSPTPRVPDVSEVTGEAACTLEFDVSEPADVFCKAKQAWKDSEGNVAGSYLFTDPDGNKLPAGYEFNPGEVFVYSVIVGNNGAGASGAVYVDDTLPDDLDYLDGDSNCVYTASSHSVRCSFDSGIGANSEERASFRVQVKDTAAIGSFENTATVSYPEKRISDTCVITLAVSEPASVVCSEKQVWADNTSNSPGVYDFTSGQYQDGATVQAGDIFVYSVILENTGGTVANNVTVEDSLPVDVEFVDAIDECVYSASAHSVSCTFSSVDAGTQERASFRVQLSDMANAGAFTNSATVTYDESDSVCDVGLNVEDTSNPTLSCVDKKIWEDEVGNTSGSYSYETQISGAVAGDTILYEIEYASSELNTITITDTLDANLEYVDSDSECSYDSATRVITCTVNVSTSSSGSVFYRAKIADGVSDGTVISNTADVENSTNSLSDSCSEDVEVSTVVVQASPSPSPSNSPTPTPTTLAESSPAPSELPEAGIMAFTTGSIGAGALLILLGLLGLLFI